jgi:hypothetical protein
MLPRTRFRRDLPIRDVSLYCIRLRLLVIQPVYWSDRARSVSAIQNAQCGKNSLDSTNPAFAFSVSLSAVSLWAKKPAQVVQTFWVLA